MLWKVSYVEGNKLREVYFDKKKYAIEFAENLVDSIKITRVK